jgi:hypothetical protein
MYVCMYVCRYVGVGGLSAVTTGCQVAAVSPVREGWWMDGATAAVCERVAETARAQEGDERECVSE